MPKINQTTLVSLPIPLPPIAEQHRIVAKVDALMERGGGQASTLRTQRFPCLDEKCLSPPVIGGLGNPPARPTTARDSAEHRSAVWGSR
jgi:hypothetical protein